MLINKPILKVENLTKTVRTNEQELKLLCPTSFAIYPKESIAIIGASGSGKSTLLGLLAGLDSASGGHIFINDQAIHNMDEDERAQVRANNVGFVYQSFMLIDSLTAIENIMLPLELAANKNAKSIADKWLSLVGLSHRPDHFPNQLSGGEQQRVAIARAFACQPKLLFADEPTGNLDQVNSQLIEELLFDLNQKHGTTLVIVTHDNKLAEKCDRTFTMQAGTIIETTSTLSNSHVAIDGSGNVNSTAKV